MIDDVKLPPLPEADVDVATFGVFHGGKADVEVRKGAWSGQAVIRAQTAAYESGRASAIDELLRSAWPIGASKRLIETEAEAPRPCRLEADATQELEKLKAELISANRRAAWAEADAAGLRNVATQREGAFESLAMELLEANEELAAAENEVEEQRAHVQELEASVAAMRMRVMASTAWADANAKELAEAETRLKAAVASNETLLAQRAATDFLLDRLLFPAACAGLPDRSAGSEYKASLSARYVAIVFERYQKTLERISNLPITQFLDARHIARAALVDKTIIA